MTLKRKQDLHAAEAASGAALGAVVGSNRVPEMTNAAVRLKRKADLWHSEQRVAGGLGKTKDGRYIKLNLLSDDKPKKPPVQFTPEGKPFTPKYDKKSPRTAAREAMDSEYKTRKAKASNPNHVPFPEGRWVKDPDTGKKVIFDPKTKKMMPAAVGELRRKAVLAVGIPAAIGVTWHGAHKWGETRDRRYRLKKRLDKNDIDGAIAGGLIGGTAYQAPSHLEWIGRKKHWEETKKKVPNADQIIDDWKTKYDVHGAQKGDKRWKKAYRNYPQSVDAHGKNLWRNARLQSRLYTGKTGAALTVGAGATGAVVGVPVVRAINRKRGKKRVG